MWMNCKAIPSSMELKNKNESPASKSNSTEELKVVFNDVQRPKEKSTTRVSNPKLKIYREFSLATLSVLTKAQKPGLLKVKTENPENVEDDKRSQIYALDAMAESGLSGLQWKKHFGDGVHVSLADAHDVSVLTMNAEHNSLTTDHKSLNGQRVPGDPCCHQAASDVHVFPVDAKALMMTEAFHFVYLYSWKSCVTYFDPACHSIKHGGVLCAVVADTSVFARSPHVVKRWYTADFIKTEYQREMVARTVLANLARSAGRYNKAILPQYVLAVDDFLLICVKINKGHKASELSVREISQLLHCRFCEERQFIPQQLAPIDQPYAALPCDCQSKNLGKTAVLLGPMWKGPIFCHSFLRLIQEEGKLLGLSSKFSSLVSLLLSEAACAVIPQSDHQSGLPPSNNTEEIPTERQRLVHVDIKLESKNSGDKKRKVTEDLNKDMLSPKKQKSHDAQAEESVVDLSRNVPFYQHVNKLKKVEVPKLDHLVSILQRAGYLASRTHFDPYAIRTTANMDQFNSSLRQHCSL